MIAVSNRNASTGTRHPTMRIELLAKRADVVGGVERVGGGYEGVSVRLREISGGRHCL
jgi:hypothetical protein